MARSPRFAAQIARATPTPAEIAARCWRYVPYDRLSAELLPDTPDELGLVFVESTAKPARRPYHKKKLALLLANQRHFALECAARGWKILYVGTDEPFGAALTTLAHAHGIARLEVARPAERELRKDLAAPFRSGLVEIVPDTSWLTTTADFATACPRQPYRMERFYAHVRTRTGILMQAGAPVGGRFSFDAENRKPWRGEPRPPERPRFVTDEITKEVLALVAAQFPDHFGTLDGFEEPVTLADAETVWTFARQELLEHFGPYEDAMSRTVPDLFHSKISALLNLSRLLPARVVRDVADDFARGELPLPSAEGFIRQVLGWREFVHHVHEATDGFRNVEPRADALPSPHRLPPAYWGTPSGMTCLDTVVGEVVRDGFSHHITRLMVLGNLATMAGWSARALSAWFWLAYVDAYDWVVEPNVRGMATYSLGGLMTTKPYVSGAAYIDKMSDYCKACALDPKRSTGEGACPVTALYWTFLDREKDRLAGNHRLAMPLAAVKKKRDLVALRATAERALERLSAGKRLDRDD